MTKESTRSRHAFVQFWMDDWRGGCSHLPPMMEWTYLQICLYCWDKVASVPKAQLPLILGRHPGWEDDLEALIAAGKVKRHSSGGVYVDRAMAEARRAFGAWKKKSDGGRAGAAKTNKKKSAPPNSQNSDPEKDEGKQDLPRESRRDTSGNAAAEPEPEPEPEPNSNKQPTSIDAAKPNGSGGGFDYVEFSDRCCRAAGVRNIDPGRITSHVSLIREWMDIGASEDAILGVISKAVGKAKEPIRSMRYFDAAVRQQVAKAQVGKTTGDTRRAYHDKADLPVCAMPDTEPELVDRIRRKLRRDLGSQIYGQWLKNAGFVVQTSQVKVICVTQFAGHFAEERYRGKLAKLFERKPSQVKFYVREKE